MPRARIRRDATRSQEAASGCRFAGERPEVANELVDLAGRERVSPRGHEGREADARAAAADRVGEFEIALLLLEVRIGEIARMRVQVEGVEAVASTRLPVTRLAVVRERDLAKAGLVRERRRSGWRRLGCRASAVDAGAVDACWSGAFAATSAGLLAQPPGTSRRTSGAILRNLTLHLAPHLPASRSTRRAAAPRDRRSGGARPCLSGRSRGNGRPASSAEVP